MSIDISNAPLKYIQIEDKTAVNILNPFATINLKSGKTLKPGSSLLINLTVLPKQDIRETEEGVVKFRISLSNFDDGKIKTRISIGFSIRFITVKQNLDNSYLETSIMIDI